MHKLAFAVLLMAVAAHGQAPVQLCNDKTGECWTGSWPSSASTIHSPPPGTVVTLDELDQFEVIEFRDVQMLTDRIAVLEARVKELEHPSPGLFLEDICPDSHCIAGFYYGNGVQSISVYTLDLDPEPVVVTEVVR